MPLTIETGAGVSGADSFNTVAEFEAGQVDLFSVALSGSIAEQEAALRRAYLYMRSLRWSEGSEFPTFGGTIPAEVMTAQIVLARDEQAKPGALAPSVVPGQQKILTRVGDLSWTPTGQTGTDAQRTEVTMALDLLKPFLSENGSTKFLARG